MSEIPPQSSGRETYYPSEENLDRNCVFWDAEGSCRCMLTKAELIGRTSCEGVVDDVCLFLKDGRRPSSLTQEQQLELRTRMPNLGGNKSYIPPGDTV